MEIKMNQGKRWFYVLFACVLSFSPFVSTHSQPASFQFPEYLSTEASELPATLKKESGNLSEEEIDRSLRRAQEAFAHKEWAVASSEYSRVLGKQFEKRDLWLRLSLSTQRRNQTERNYQWEQLARKAAVRAYQLSRTPEEQAEALLVYAETFNPADDFDYPQYYQAMEAANTLTNLAKLKMTNKDLQNVGVFRYLQPRVNVDKTPANVCFSFSTPLQTEGINFSDYVSISPKVDGNIKASGREICLSPLEFGATYNITLKAGIKDIFGEKTEKDISLSIKVRDQESRLSFKTKAYVLKTDEKALVPLSGINVDQVSIKLLRVPKTTLFSVIGQSKDFLTGLWDYQITRIGDEVGEKLYEGEMDFSTEKNKTVTKQIPFFDMVKSGEPGIYIIQAEEKYALLGNKAQATQWLVISDVGITTFTDQNGGIWANIRSLKTALPLSGLEVNLISHNNKILNSQKTNKEGMVFFDANATKGKGGDRPLMILANSSKDDFNFLSLESPAFDFSDRGVSGRLAFSPMEAFLYTEQGVYRPGSTVHVNALLRDEKGLLISAKFPLTFKVLRSDETLVKSETVMGNELGLYELSIPLQSSVRLGQWTVLAYADPRKDPVGRVTFAVEDFVPSRVVVQLKANQERLSTKTPTEIQVAGKYLFGSPAAGMKGEASLILRPRANPYPEYKDYHFGLVTENFQNIQMPEAVPALDKEGKGSFEIQLEKPPQTSLPIEGVIRVLLTDQGGRPEIGTLTLPVETFTGMIGIKPLFKNNTVSESDAEAAFEIILLDETGKLKSATELNYEFVEENIQYTWYRQDQYSAWQYKTLVEDKFLQNGKVSTQPEGSTRLTLSLKEWGRYRLELKDPYTGAATSVRFQKGWVTSGETTETPDKIRIKLEKDLVKPGDTIELQVESPFEGQALLTLANNQVIETQNIEVSKKGSRVRLRAKEQWGAGVYCMISAFRPLPNQHGFITELLGGNKSFENKTNEQSFLPKRAIGLTWIGIDPTDRSLDVQFEIPSEVRPQQTIEIPITVLTKEAQSSSSKVQLTFAAVDEGILKLTDFITPNPVDFFLGKRTLGVEQRDLYGKLIDPIPGPLGELRQGGDSGMLSRNMQALSKRSFKVISLYSGLVIPDRNGKAKVKVTLPDFNGKLRLMAIAFDEKRFGSGAAPLLVRDPIIIEGVLPRFLSPQDKSSFSVSLHNVAAPQGKYTVQISTKGPVALTESMEPFEVTLEKNGTQDFRIPIEAKKVGDGKILVSIKGEGLEISSSYDISVRSTIPYVQWTSNYLLKSQESFKLTHDIKTNMIDASDAMLTLSSRLPWDTQILSQQLARYPYGCVEQITSRGMGALFGGKRMLDQVNQTLALLSEKQSSSGGFYLWTLPNENGGGNGGDLFLTSYVMDFYLEAKLANFDVPKFTLERGLEWLKQSIDRKSKYTSDELSGAAYALYVLTKANQLETGALRYFTDTYFEQINNPLSRAMLGTALAMKGEQERAENAFKSIFDMPVDGKMTVGPFGSALRNQAGILCLSLGALKVSPNLTSAQTWIEASTHYLQKAMRSLETDHNASDRGASLTDENTIPRMSTQELAWILLASQALNRDSSKEGIEFAVDGKRSYATKESLLHIPVSAQDLKKGIQLSNKGKQNVWLNASISYLPDAPPKAQQRGMTLETSYYDLEGNKVDPSRVTSGKQWVVVIKGSQENTRSHQVLIVDPLPAGFEIQNTKDFEESELFQWLPTLSKPAFTEARDDRYVAAIDIDENNSKFRLAYLIRAITPGIYIKPGLFAEDMYAPNFFAQYAETSVEVLAP